jgi:hypothetical protein
MKDHSNLSCGIPAILFTALGKREFDLERSIAVMQG